jgi:N-acetylneuraminic acid mutarotase
LIAYHERLYAIGGRIYGGDDVSLLNKCERYDLFTNEWTEICPMHQRRCTAMTFLYKDQLWVFGGYTAHLKRSSLVERFVEEEDRWEKIEFRLYQGFEAGHVFALAPNKILVVGGKIYGGECNYVHEIDLHEGTILNKA